MLNSIALTLFVICVRVESFVQLSNGISPIQAAFRTSPRLVGRSMSSEPGDKDDALSYDEAYNAIQEEADKKNMDKSGDEENKKNYEENRGTFDNMRSEIQSRASDLSLERSVATAEAIKLAAARAASGASDAEPSLDLSKLEQDPFKDPKYELTDEQKREVDKVGYEPVWTQAIEEFKSTKFPTFDAIFKLSILMVIIFVTTAGIIIKTDEFLRYIYTEWELIPAPNQVFDYSDLTLPEGWADDIPDPGIGLKLD